MFFYLLIFLFFVLFFLSSKFFSFIRYLCFCFSIFFFFYFLSILFFFNLNTVAVQSFFLMFQSFFFMFGFDGLSVLFNLLTTFLFPLVFLSSWRIYEETKLFFLSLFFVEFLLVLVFSVLDLFLFYIFFELILIPMLLLILNWGSRAQKVKAMYYFFFYTFFGSFFMLLGLIGLYFAVGTTNLIFLYNIHWDFDSSNFFWFVFFIGFSIKIPMFPFHIWLPEAHVEAPTVGSVILAGLLLKLGSYGFLRVLLPLFQVSCFYFTPLVFLLAVLSIYYCSLIILCQVDLKKIIAYSSIVHMNYAILGLFIGSIEGLSGSVFLMLSHGVTSSALFFLVGFLYDRFHSRLLFYYSGLSSLMPIFFFFFFLFSFANFGFPGLANFIGEFLIFINVINLSEIFLFFLFFSLFLSLIYSILLFNRLFLGEFKLYYLNFLNYLDISLREGLIILPLVILLFFLGIFPSFVLVLCSCQFIFF